MVAENFQIYSVKITANTFVIHLFICTHAPSKTLPQVFIIISQADENCPKTTKISYGIGHKF